MRIRAKNDLGMSDWSTPIYVETAEDGKMCFVKDNIESIVERLRSFSSD